ncbi:MAG: hypothetical protein D4R64_05425 [Porphyromonadaceae bacterium]|nr:MAG: hypothetical protein D4R64_05425 [Porphyromonadaceae bacterium]
MKIAWIVVSLSVLLLTACESTEDVLNSIDHTVPSVQFNPDTLEVTAGENVTLNAVVEDESGLQRIEFTYGDWRINEIIDLSDDSNTVTYPFSLDIKVPADALKEWEENSYFNDGSSIKIIQQYHKLALSAWDKNKNLNTSYCYVKVK